ncbi:MAG: RepB family plasmid replication initiator protein [Bacilli bacterium]|nr:RepB family plasmid replication initiator protein [Bacilli bacterium]
MARISTKTPKVKERQELCKIDNQLIEAFVKKGNLPAFKILFFIASSNIEITGDIMKFNLDTKSICERCNIDLKTLKRNVKQMTETSISIIDEQSESYMTVIPKAKFNYSGKLEITMLKEVLQLVKATQNQFTIINASKVMKLGSKHSVRMLMLLEYIKGFDEHVAKRKHYDLEEMNLMFGTNYKKITDLERFILVPVKEELDATSRLSFVYEVHKDKPTATVGRAKALGVIIDLVQNTPQRTLF